jgi:RecA/RadA recombinase
MRNLVRMVAKSEADLKLKLKKLALGTEKRAEAVKDKSIKPDDKIEIRNFDGSNSA